MFARSEKRFIGKNSKSKPTEIPHLPKEKVEGGQKIEWRQATERSQTDSEPKQYIHTQWYNETTLDEIGIPNCQ